MRMGKTTFTEKFIEQLEERIKAIDLEVAALKKAGDEKEKVDKDTLQERADLEKEFSDKLFEQTHARIEIIKKEKDERLAEANALGAATVDIEKFYNGLILEEAEKLEEEKQKIMEGFADQREEEHAAILERIIEEREAEQSALQEKLDEMFAEQEVKNELREVEEEAREELNEALMEDHELELEQLNEKRDVFQKNKLDQNKINEWYTKEKAKLDKIAADKEIAERDRAYKDALTVGGALVSLAKDVTGWIGSLWEKETAREIEAGNLSDREKKKKLRDEAQRQKALAVFNAIITGALAVLTALTAGPILGPIMAVIAGIAAAIQIGIIVAEPLPAWNKGGLNITKRLQDGGLFEGAPGIDTNLARLTSGEFIVNKDATAANIDTLEDINTGGGGGGGVTINPMPLLIEVDGRAQAEYTIEFLAEESDRGNVRVNPKAIRERA